MIDDRPEHVRLYGLQGGGATGILMRLLGLLAMATLAVAGLLIVLVVLAAAVVLAPIALLVYAVLRINGRGRRPRPDGGTVIEVEYERRD